jgi:TonB family protein
MRSHIKIAVLAALAASFAASALQATDANWSRDAIEKIAAHKTTPRSAQLRGAKGTVEMDVKVDGNGMITDYQMVKSSGVPILDREADLIIMRVGSFESPPGRSPTELVIPIRW